MPVQFQMNANGLGNIRLSESRINRMLSGDRDQALYMGFWDKFADLFRGIGGHKKAEILGCVWNLLNTNPTTPENSVQTEGDILKRSIHIFNQLKEFADPVYKNLFKIYMINDTVDITLMKVSFTIGGNLLKEQHIRAEYINLENVDVINVSMNGADLTRVNMKGAINLSYDALDGSTLPSGFLKMYNYVDDVDFLMKYYKLRFVNEPEVNNEQIKNEPLNEKTGAGTRTAEEIPSEQLVEAGDLSEEPAYQGLNVRSDGYCFFRCLLIQETKDDKWAQCSAKEVLPEIISRYKESILKAIVDAYKNLDEIQMNFNNQNLAAVLKDSSNLLAYTITDEGGFLWSPKGICARPQIDIDYEELSDGDATSLGVFCDAVFTQLQSKLKLNMDKSKGSYATVEGAHYTWYKKLD
ncbi:hypothetical protein NY904_004457 [Escherichia coli]|nr:hypothetical protein [Escherichia coli]